MISAPMPGVSCWAKALSTPRLPPGARAGGEHAFVQPVPGVTEMCVAALTLSGAETV
jgi:hypothetical protein